MIDCTCGSARNPISRARGVLKRTGQVLTMAWMRASGFQSTRAAVFAPATRFRVSTISETAAVMPGRLTTRCPPQTDPGSSSAWMNASTTRRGDSSHTPVSGPTGHSEATPFSGSRKRPAAEDEPQWFGWPASTDAGRLDYRLGCGSNHPPPDLRIRNIAGNHLQPRVIRDPNRKRAIEQGYPRDPRTAELAPREQGLRETPPYESAAARDQNFHAASLAKKASTSWRLRVNLIG